MSKLKMVEKNGKKVPFYAADGVGKMKPGGAVKKSLRPKARPKKNTAPKQSKNTAPKRSLRPKARPEGLSDAGAIDRGTRAAEREAQDYKSIVQRKASGGICRGMGAATRGGKFSRA